jgi:4-hydroxybenzoate polyprenyltransferase
MALALSQLPPLTWYLSPIVLAAFVLYPFTKRFTSLCHLFLGATIGLAPVGAWVAVTSRLAWQPFLLMGAVTFWIGGFDIAYGCLDVDFDRRERIHSLPVSLGVGKALLIMRFFHVLAVALLTSEGWVRHRSAIYFIGVAVIAAMLAVENTLVSTKNLSRIGAFMTVNGFIGIAYIVFLTADLLVYK